MRRLTPARYAETTEPPWDRADVPWIARLAARWGITILGFLAAEAFVNWLYDRDRIFIEGWEALLAAAAIFVILRALVRPILVFLTCPLQLITLGLFILVINAVILLLTEEVAGWFDINFSIDGFLPAFIGALVISLVSFAFSRALRRNPFS